MTNTAIKVENIGKSYFLGHCTPQAGGYTALRDVLARNAKSFIRKTRDMLNGSPIVQGDEVEEFWALRDINFEIKQGERVGIIGRNGAGKSTLLKILSRIIEPSIGRVTISGRVASLLEVGTGFHPELTGRENIFLNGAILGMSRREIQQKFDQIVDFAEVERFLDTPVKRYSSGMYVRLAFAVAAHLEPEILVVDEVLAVGDAQFQNKCMGKMEDVASEGRTVIFVSHNMAAVESLTERAIVLDKGHQIVVGDTRTCIESYLTKSRSLEHIANFKFEDTEIRLSMLDSNGQQRHTFQCGEDIILRFDCQSKTTQKNIDFQIPIFSSSGMRLLSLSGRYQSKSRITLSGNTVVTAKWQNPCIVPGVYDIAFAIYRDGVYQTHWDNAIQLNISESDFYGTGKMPDVGMGSVLSKCDWAQF